MKKESESALALRAMKRAALIARHRAAEKNLKIPVWKNGRIVHVDPMKGLDAKDAVNGLLR